MIKFNCPSCSKLLSIDEGKLPMREVQVPCPSCSVKIPVDRRKIATGGTVQTALPKASAGAAPVVAGEVAVGDIEITPAAQPWPGSAGKSAAVIAPDADLAEKLSQALRELGFRVVDSEPDDDLADLIMREQPYLVVLDAGTISPPPSEALSAVTSLSAADRRKLFLALITENLKSMDGNAAFLYQANVVLHRRDLKQFSHLLQEGLNAHEKLYAPYNRARGV